MVTPTLLTEMSQIAKCFRRRGFLARREQLAGDDAREPVERRSHGQTISGQNVERD
jgi:hypothetical protein